MRNLYSLNDFLYLLQLEEYDSIRYARLLPRFYFRRNLQIRDSLKNTKRIGQMRIAVISLQILTISVIGWGILGATNIFFLQVALITVLIFTTLTITPHYVLLTNLLMTPWYEYLKHNKEKVATEIIIKRNDLKIIAITGSYGKTTTKHVLYELLKNNYRVQFTPGTINTPTGIAQWLIDNLKENTQILIIEMDAYLKGEIARSCAITPPNIALITNFGDQHLERFGSHENLTLAYLEAFTGSAKNAQLVLTSDEYQKTLQYEATSEIISKLDIRPITTAQLSDLYGQFTIFKTFTSSQKLNIGYAVLLARSLHIPDQILHLALQNIKLPDRRGDIKVIDNYLVLDRSYNISEYTAKQGVNEAYEFGQKEHKKIIIITAGIPERGEESERVNKEYGQFLKGCAEYIIVLQSIYAASIEAGIGDHAKIRKATRMSEAFEIAKKLGSYQNYIILMQPELTDLSY